jgi:hypothetical protein
MRAAVEELLGNHHATTKELLDEVPSTRSVRRLYSKPKTTEQARIVSVMARDAMRTVTVSREVIVPATSKQQQLKT